MIFKIYKCLWDSHTKPLECGFLWLKCKVHDFFHFGTPVLDNVTLKTQQLLLFLVGQIDTSLSFYWSKGKLYNVMCISSMTALFTEIWSLRMVLKNNINDKKLKREKRYEHYDFLQDTSVTNDLSHILAILFQDSFSIRVWKVICITNFF